MKITVTGADERTAIDCLVELVRQHDRLEIGLLYTATPEGRNRYPSLDWIRRTVAALGDRTAIHVCGSAARRQFLAGDLQDLTRLVPRFQINGLVQADELRGLSKCAQWIITQHNESNAVLVDVDVENHCLLIDASGGRGVCPQHWPALPTDKRVGFAGGLGVDNLAAELARMGPVSGPGAWVDMEGRLRKDDWFDLGLATQCVRIFEAFMNSRAANDAAAAAPAAAIAD